MGKAITAPAFEVNIVVSGEICTEYDDENAEDSPALCSKYIECQSGAQWAVSWTIDPKLLDRKHSYQLECICDGQSLRNFNIMNRQSKKHEAKMRSGNPWTSTAEYITFRESGRTYKQHFTFKKFETSTYYMHLMTDEETNGS